MRVDLLRKEHKERSSIDADFRGLPPYNYKRKAKWKSTFEEYYFMGLFPFPYNGY